MIRKDCRDAAVSLFTDPLIDSIGLYKSFGLMIEPVAVPMYLSPAQMSLVLREDVSDAKSPRSKQVTDKPRVEAISTNSLLSLPLLS